MAIDTTIVKDTNNQLNIQRERYSFLLGDNFFIEGEVTASGADVVFEQGAVVARLAATGKIVDWDSTATTTGAQIYLGVIAEGQTIVDGTTENVSICVKGVVAEERIKLTASQTLETVVDQERLRDSMTKAGIVLSLGTDNTTF